MTSRYNRANYSLDGDDGPAVDVVPGGYDDIEDPNAHVVSVTEDVDFDPLIYDYVMPKAKHVDALRIISDPDKGGVDVVRIPPAKYV